MMKADLNYCYYIDSEIVDTVVDVDLYLYPDSYEFRLHLFNNDELSFFGTTGCNFAQLSKYEVSDPYGEV